MRKKNVCETCQRFSHCMERSRGIACRDYKKKDEKGGGTNAVD